MNKYIFSRNVSEYLRTPGSFFHEIYYKMFLEKKETEINPMLDPTPEDIKVIMSKVSAINNYLVDSSEFASGIIYLNIMLGGIRAEYLVKGTPAEVAKDMLTAYRSHWVETRCLDPAPFITLLTPRALQLAVPISIQGYRTLAEIQKSQQSVKREQMKQQANVEVRKAKALRNYDHF